MVNKKILITGVAGFIGSKIASKFANSGYEVIGIDDLSGGKINNVPKNIKFIKMDLSNKKLYGKIPKNCKSIFHLAGQSSGEISFHEPVNDLKKNVISTLNLIDYGIKNRAKIFYYASSMSVYGKSNKKKFSEYDICKPLSNYGNGKIASENYIKNYKEKLPFVIFRMFNVYGPGQDMKNLKQGMVSIYLSQALNKKKIIVKGSLNRKRDFIFIDDVVDCWFKSFHSKIKNETINLGTGKSISVRKLLRLIQKKILGTKIKVIKGTPGDQFSVCANNNILRKKLNIKKFINIDEGLTKFINHFN